MPGGGGRGGRGRGGKGGGGGGGWGGRLQEVGVKTNIEIGAGGAARIHAYSSTSHTAFLSFTKAEVR